MGIADLPLLGQIKGRLTWLDERQRVIAENVANADTPGYVGRDLSQPADFAWKRAAWPAGAICMALVRVIGSGPPPRRAAAKSVGCCRSRPT